MSQFSRFCFLSVCLIFSPPLGAEANNKVLMETYTFAIKDQDCSQVNALIPELKKKLQDYIFLSIRGEAFELGHCVEQDIDKAMELYKEAYSLTQVQAMLRIGTLYLTKKNNQETAQKWFRTFASTMAPLRPDDERRIADIKVTKRMFIEAFDGKRVFPDKEFDDAMKWASDLMQGSPENAFKYVQFFEEGLDGYPINKEVADRLLIKAADSDYPPAAWKYAQQLLEKSETEYNYLRHSVSYLKTAALADIVDAQLVLAQVFIKLEKFRMAYEWYVYARKNGASVKEEIMSLEKKLDPYLAQFYQDRIEKEGEKPR